MKLGPLLMIPLFVYAVHDTFSRLPQMCKVLSAEEETICTTEIVDSALNVGYEKMMKLQLNITEINNWDNSKHTETRTAYIKEATYYDLLTTDDYVPCWKNSKDLVRFGERDLYMLGLYLLTIIDVLILCSNGQDYMEIMFTNACALCFIKWDAYSLAWVFIGIKMACLQYIRFGAKKQQGYIVFWGSLLMSLLGVLHGTTHQP